MVEDKTTFDKVMEKAAAKKLVVKERTEERAATGAVNKLVIERNPTGLYSVRYSLSGPVPNDLKGFFTRKDRILAIANIKKIPVEESVI